MATCKDCLHFEACVDMLQTLGYVVDGDGYLADRRCRIFKDRSRFIETPCEIGTRIFMIVTKRPKITMPEFSFIKTSYMTENNFFRVIRDFGKTIFLTHEEAEAALAKMGGDG